MKTHHQNTRDYAIGQANLTELAPKAQTFKKKGDPNATFSLYVKYQNAVQMYDRTTGQKETRDHFTFYSKLDGQPEKDTPTIIENLKKVLDAQVQKGIKYATIYYNLNCGLKVNYFWKKNQDILEIPFSVQNSVKNIQIMYFDRNGQIKSSLGDKIYYLPRMSEEILNQTNLNRYYNDLADLQSRGLNEVHRKIIYHYFDICYNSFKKEPTPTLQTTPELKDFSMLSSVRNVQKNQKPNATTAPDDEFLDLGFTPEQIEEIRRKYKK